MLLRARSSAIRRDPPDCKEIGVYSGLPLLVTCREGEAHDWYVVILADRLVLPDARKSNQENFEAPQNQDKSD
jgi:hypothetical protein